MTPRVKKTLAIILVAVNIVICLATLLSSFGGYFNPEKFHSVPAIAVMTFPLWAVVVPVMALVDFFILRKTAAIPAAVMIVCLGQFLNFFPLNIFGHGDCGHGEDEFTLLTYNTYQYAPFDSSMSGIREPNLSIQAIIDADADIVCLQESDIPSQSDKDRITVAQIDTLFAEYPRRCASDQATLAVMSRFDIEKASSPELHDETASCLKCRLDINGHKLTVYDTHLQSIGLDSDDKELYYELTEGNARHNIRRAKSQLLAKLSHAFKIRAAQARIIRDDIMADSAKNVIVCGDFNDISGCYAIRCLSEAGLSNAYTDCGFGPSVTYRADRFYFHIDHILYKGDLVPIAIKTLKLGLSDHYPVFARFRFVNHN